MIGMSRGQMGGEHVDRPGFGGAHTWLGFWPQHGGGRSAFAFWWSAARDSPGFLVARTRRRTCSWAAGDFQLWSVVGVEMGGGFHPTWFL